ncbi:MAG: T9SS type A sorting domain-containing protein [Chitinophagales bacterium]
MKKITPFINRGLRACGFITIILLTTLSDGHAQDTWTQKADFGGTARGGASGFSIGSKGYIGTGNTLGGLVNDFWEYDATTNAWAQKADFGGSVRRNAVGFSIGNKGYIGTGYSFAGPYLKDFWEYDPANNSWTQKASVGGAGRFLAVGFSIGSKGYVGSGANFFVSPYYKYDFWEYDPATDTWTQKANFGAAGRYAATAFTIGNKGYVGTGYNAAEGNKKDFWEYDPATDSWTQKADFSGTARRSAAGFSLGTTGYIGTGYDGTNFTNDFWAYNPANDNWSQQANYGGSATWTAVGFSIGGSGYIGTGESYTKSFWAYTPGISTCAIPANLSASDITPSSANLSWDAAAGSIKYKIRYKASGTGAWIIKSTTGTSLIVNGLSPTTTYTWQVKNICASNPVVASDWSAKQKFVTVALKISDELISQAILQIYPNPVADHATIQFTVNQPSHVQIRVFDVSGREMETLLDENMEQGAYSVQINTDHFTKGVYFVKMISDSGINNQKLIVQ